MYPRQVVLTACLLAPLALTATEVTAGENHAHEHDDEHRQQGAHVHGIAALNLALEGQEVHLELDSPAANIVGFEHTPSSEADHAALDKAIGTLKDGDRLFRFNADAGCRLEEAAVTTALLDEEHKGHADEHDHEKHDGHDHDEHDHEAHEREGETHSDIEAAYHFECDRPGKLAQLTVELFAAFPGTEKLNVQYVTESKQGAVELTPADHVVKF